DARADARQARRIDRLGRGDSVRLDDRPGRPDRRRRGGDPRRGSLRRGGRCAGAGPGSGGALMPSIPLVNLQRQYERLGPQVDGALRDVCGRGDFILGRAVAEFETAFAAFVGAKHAIGVASGTDALHLILRALGIGAGDEVIVPANTFIATAQAVWCTGATPVL